MSDERRNQCANGKCGHDKASHYKSRMDDNGDFLLWSVCLASFCECKKYETSETKEAGEK